MSVDLADRYGTKGGRRPLLITVVVIVVVAFLGWLVWAAWLHSNPQVSSTMNSWKVVDDHKTTIVVRVKLEDGVDSPNCRARALASDHSVVGELQFKPVDGTNEQTITTERRADSVEWIGCTSKDQRRAQ
ncbi:DUF4307 domain-containing protein [Nocardioides daejeonensis]|uniref:DUF4307 domain-containing protein n=1 Tax=Nocardioides daejeonensis TaxID=1046556 RepID=UPI0013A5A816|nr:DUF4307 domain-containing protein [Nocardioides daejeonensis]